MARAWGPARSTCERIDALIESYVDGDSTPAECRELEGHVDLCAACRAELELAESVATSLRTLPTVTRPRFGDAPLDAPPAPRPWPPSRSPEGGDERASRSGPSSNHLLLQAAAVLLLLSGLWLAIDESPLLRFGGSDPGLGGSDHFSEAELQTAEEDLRIALAYFGGLAEKAGFVVRDDVLGERVAAPTRRAFRRIGDLTFDSDSVSAEEMERP